MSIYIVAEEDCGGNLSGSQAVVGGEDVPERRPWMRRSHGPSNAGGGGVVGIPGSRLVIQKGFGIHLERNASARGQVDRGNGYYKQTDFNQPSR